MHRGMLEVRAGKRAYEHLMIHGLRPTDITAIFGASGAAKWLAIAGLDSAIFSDWLPQSSQPIDLYGTSVGAIKLAAAVQRDPAARIADLADAYIEQRYDGVPHPDEIQLQGEVILERALGEDGVDWLLNNPRYHFHCGAVECGGRLAIERKAPQALAMTQLALQNFKGKQTMRSVKRVVFSSPNNQAGDSRFKASDNVETKYISLNEENLKEAIRASGSIPFYMNGVRLPCVHANGADLDILRDGGLLDYHPSPANFSRSDEGYVLYPHFYGRVVETWFDKFLPWRRLSAEALNDVILIYPGEQYLERTALKRIPDRKDFNRYNNKDELRMKLWREVLKLSYELGEEWLELTHRQSWDRVKPLGN